MGALRGFLTLWPGFGLVSFFHILWRRFFVAFCIDLSRFFLPFSSLLFFHKIPRKIHTKIHVK